MNDYEYYNRQMDLYMELRSEQVTRIGREHIIREYMAMSQEYIVIHRTDKLSPKKEVKNFKFE